MSDLAKKNAALAALELVEDGMVLGLGTGSTAAHFVDALGERVAAGLSVSGAPTSLATERQARGLGIPLIDLDAAPQIHLTVDGADEFDPKLNLIKGGGAALLREKIIADASDRMIVIADASKEVSTLGAFPLPIEVNPFGLGLTDARIGQALASLGLADAMRNVRMADTGAPLRTDGDHIIIDVQCDKIEDPKALADLLDKIPGVVEHGLFVDLADLVLIGDDGGVRRLAR